MSKLATKHSNAEIITFSDFSGGLNLSKPSEFIENNEMSVADNLEFSPNTGTLKIRGGIVPVYTFPNPVTDIFPVAGADSMLVKSGMEIYKFTLDEVTLLGEVDGDLPGVYEFWGENKELLLAFGRHLHIYDGKTLKRITTQDAPEYVNTVTYSYGRVMVTQVREDSIRSSVDTIRYSGLGDPFKWTYDEAYDAVHVEVGYKDGCDMTAIAEMAGEILVFKCPPGQPEYGRVYRLQGASLDTWNVIPYATGLSAWNPNAIVNISNGLLFLTKEGLASLETVSEYGDFRQTWAGAKINPTILSKLTDQCRLWHIPSRGQVWLWDGESNEIWVYHVQMGGAWTKFIFHGPVRAVAYINKDTYLAIGNILYKMSDQHAKDQIEEIVTGSLDEEEVDPTVPILGKWRPKMLIRRNQILVKGMTAAYMSSIEVTGVMIVEGFRMPLPITTGGDIAALDTDIAVLDTDPLVVFQSSITRRRCNIRKWSITPEIQITNGMFNLFFVNLELAEV